MADTDAVPQAPQFRSYTTVLHSVLCEPYASWPLRCVEHHRLLRQAGYCPSCLLRRIDAACASPPGYGMIPGWQGALLEQIYDILAHLHKTQFHASIRSAARKLKNPSIRDAQQAYEDMT